MKILRQFSAFASIVWQNTLAYRSENIVWLFIETIPIVIQLSLWNSLNVLGKIDEKTVHYMTLYYVVGLFIARLTGSHYEEWLIEHIRDGTISGNLIKPFSYKLFVFANEMVWRISGLSYTIPILLLLLPLFYSALGSFSISLSSLLLFSIILVFAFIQRFFVSWLISVSAFWLEESSVFVHFKWMLEGLVGGQWLPISFYPKIFQSIVVYTPFYTWYSLPIGIALKTVSPFEITRGVLVSMFWTITLYVLSNILWKKAMKKYSASGG